MFICAFAFLTAVAQLPFCKTVVGGAVLTADYAARIGADYYSKDAAATVRAAKEVYGRN